MLELTLFLAQQQPGGGGGGQILWIGLILMIVVYMVVMMGGRKEKRKQQEMLANIKKNDRVMTIGGILATVVGVDGNEITLKVDESANVKIRVIRGAIQRVLAEGEAPTEIKRQ